MGFNWLRKNYSAKSERREEIEVTIKLPDKLSAPVIKGQIVGEQCYYVNGELVKSLPVKAVKDVSRIDYQFCLKKLVKLALL